MRQDKRVEIVEYYDKHGVCRKRTANGMDLPPDTEPSVTFFARDAVWAIQKRYLTQEEFVKRYPRPKPPEKKESTQKD